jgi:uncharacterized protein (UPF0335 family)
MARDTTGETVLPLDEKAGQGTGRALDTKELRGLVEQWDRLEERGQQLAEDRRDYWTWAKARGFDVDGLRLYFQRRRNRDRWHARAALADLYEDRLDHDAGPMFDEPEAQTAEAEAAAFREALVRGGIYTIGLANMVDARAIARKFGFSDAAVELVIGEGRPEVVGLPGQSFGQADEPKAPPKATITRVEVTTPKGRTAKLKASDPLVRLHAASVEGHGDYCACDDCLALRRGILAEKVADHEAKAAESSARVDALVEAAEPAKQAAVVDALAGRKRAPRKKPAAKKPAAKKPATKKSAEQ